MLLFFSQAAISIKISNLFICFCSFDLSCPTLEKTKFYQNNLHCIVLLNSVIFKILFVSKCCYSNNCKINILIFINLTKSEKQAC